MSEGNFVFLREVVNMTSVREAVRKRTGRLPSINETTTAFKALGGGFRLAL